MGDIDNAVFNVRHILQEHEMAEEESAGRVKTPGMGDSKKETGSPGDTAFGKFVRLFKTNGIIYGSAVCSSPIKNGSSPKYCNKKQP